jgi:NADH-quinone oxidoreductase subunit H
VADLVALVAGTGLLAAALKIGILVGVLFTAVAYVSFAERRVAGFIQERLGPNRVGPWGLLQPLADGLKFIFKEEIVPAAAHRPTFILAPAIWVTTALAAYAVLPFGGPFEVVGRTIVPQIADLEIGILYVLAIASLGVYGIVLAGWSSNNKYSLMGGLRSSAQLISYELAMTLSVVGVLMAAGSLRLADIVGAQAGTVWYVLAMPLGCFIFVVSAFAETNRLPFDLPEAEAEIVAGYHTEYSSMKFAMFYLGEYINMTLSGAMMVLLFLGGWHLPWVEGLLGGLPAAQRAAAHAAIFAGKTCVLIFVFMWVRWTLPRFRYDQLMRLGWKVLLPLALVNILYVGGAVLLGWF